MVKENVIVQKFYFYPMSEFRELMDALVQFRNERDWQQFHDSKNLAVALSIEASELNELFLWKDVNASEEVNKEKNMMLRGIKGTYVYVCDEKLRRYFREYVLYFGK